MHIYMHMHMYYSLRKLVRFLSRTCAPPLITQPVEYAERGNEYGILFTCSLFCEYSILEYVRIYVMDRVETGGIRHSHSCGCATGIREYLFNT